VKKAHNKLMQYAPSAPDATFGCTADEGRYATRIK
jgi:hypothetical protein